MTTPHPEAPAEVAEPDADAEELDPGQDPDQSSSLDDQRVQPLVSTT